jgi:hypothetical protein
MTIPKMRNLSCSNIRAEFFSELPVASPVVSSDNSSRIVRFGALEVDLKAGDLHRSGLKVKLQERPSQVLAVLPTWQLSVCPAFTQQLVFAGFMTERAWMQQFARFMYRKIKGLCSGVKEALWSRGGGLFLESISERAKLCLLVVGHGGSRRTFGRGIAAVRYWNFG